MAIDFPAHVRGVREMFDMSVVRALPAVFKTELLPTGR